MYLHRTLLEPTSVQGAVFSAEHGLVVSRRDRILVAETSVRVQGRIAAFALLHGSLICCLEDGEVLNLLLDDLVGQHTVNNGQNKRKTATANNGNVHNANHAPQRVPECGPLVATCQKHSIAALYPTIGLLKFIMPFKKEFCTSIDTIDVMSIAFIHNEKYARLAILYQETSKDSRLIRLLDVNYTNKTADCVFQKDRRVDAAALFIVPVSPLAGGGVLVIGEARIELISADKFESTQNTAAINISPTIIKTHCEVNPVLHLLTDFRGKVFILKIATKLSLHEIFVSDSSDPAPITIASCSVWMGNGRVYLGSHYSDSQFIYIEGLSHIPTAFAVNEKVIDFETSSLDYKVTQNITNIAPMTSFCSVPIEGGRYGQTQLLGCTGAFHTGAITIIRNGVEILPTLSLQLGICHDIWTFNGGLLAGYYMGYTRVFSNAANEFREISDSGFQTTQNTITCADITKDYIVQVTTIYVTLIESKTFARISVWRSPDVEIMSACISDSKVVVALTGGLLVYFRFSDGGIYEDGRIELEKDVSAICVFEDYCLVSIWNEKDILIMHLPDFEVVSTETLPTSNSQFSFQILSCDVYIFVSSEKPSDGKMYSYIVGNKFVVSQFTIYSFGTTSISIRKGPGLNNVFISGDAPAILYCSNKALKSTNINLDSLKTIIGFPSCSNSGDGVAILGEAGVLTLGTFSDSMKLSVKKIYVGETIRRIAHHSTTQTIAIICTKPHDSNSTIKSSLKILNTKITEVDSFAFNDYELAVSLNTAMVGGKEFLVVGTGLVHPTENEPSNGRILFFLVRNSKVFLEHVVDVEGCVYVIEPITFASTGYILASVNASVLLVGPDIATASNLGTDLMEMKILAVHLGHVMGVALSVTGSTFAVGDLMKSVTIVDVVNVDSNNNVIQQTTGTRLGLLERKHDPTINWITGVCFSGDEIVCSDNSYNVFMMKWSGDEDVMQVTGRFHIGELINRIIPATLQVSSNSTVHNSDMIFCTVNGMLGSLCKLDASISRHLGVLEKVIDDYMTETRNQLVGTICGAGNTYLATRTFRNRTSRLESFGVIDGDLLGLFLALDNESRKSLYAVYKSAIESTDGSEIVIGKAMSLEKICETVAWE